MKKIISSILTLLILVPCVLSGKPIGFKDVAGRWRLLYRGNYGYDFYFYNNYRAIVIVYLRSSAVVFRGVYTIEENNQIRINISEMKNEPSATNINLKSRFVKTSSSYFTFIVDREDAKGKKILSLKPGRIVIDGLDSEGYFEPVIKLDKAG